MACDTIRVPGQTRQQREAEITTAVKRLAAALASGAVTLRVGPRGAIVIVGWTTDNRGITDACALRSLQLSHGWELRKALAKAEAAAGRKADMRMVAAGWHSHDSGQTWGKH